jgi:thiamine biosynthesis protein ThiC
MRNERRAKGSEVEVDYCTMCGKDFCSMRLNEKTREMIQKG